MGKEMLRKEEKNRFSTIYSRIEEAMKGTPYSNMAELDRAIAEDRGGSPGQSFYTKLSKDRQTKGEKFTNITIENLYVIAEKLNVTTDYLLGYQRKVQEDEIDFSELQYLGLSEVALKKLFATNNSALEYDPKKIRSGSRYYRNPYHKVLDALNWIISHIDVNEDEQHNDNYDFLTTIYHMVMLNFPDYRGAIVEAVLNGAQNDSYKEWDKYYDLLSRYENPIDYGPAVEVEHEGDEELSGFIETIGVTGNRHAEVKRALDEARKNLVKMHEWRAHDRKVMEDIKNGIIAVNDPVTYDDVRITLADPKDVFKKHLFEIVQDWNEEFKPTYLRKKEQQKADYDEWFEKVKDEPWPTDSDFKYEEEDEEDVVPEELLYRRQWLCCLSEMEMKLYMLLEYFEKSELKLIRVSDEGEVLIANLRETSNEAISEFVSKAEEDGVGIYFQDGKIFYSPDRASSTRERNEKLFYRYNLPYYLEHSLRRNETGTITKSADYDPDFCYADFTEEEVEKIYEEAKARGYSWEVKGHFIDITRGAK